MMRLLLLVLGLGACTAGNPPFGSRDQAGLARELAGRSAGQSERCVPSTTSRSLRIVDNQTIVYRQGQTLWVNHLENECPGLRPMSTLVVELHDSQYCRGDLFRPVDYPGSIPGARCRLGDFVPYRRPPR